MSPLVEGDVPSPNVQSKQLIATSVWATVTAKLTDTGGPAVGTVVESKVTLSGVWAATTVEVVIVVRSPATSVAVRVTRNVPARR